MHISVTGQFSVVYQDKLLSRVMLCIQTAANHI